MLIEIKKNIITEAIKRKGQKQNEPLDLLFQMAICAKKGFHVVWVPALESDRQLRTELSSLITEANVNALCYADAMHRQDVGWLNSHLPVKAVLSYEKVANPNGCIVINPILESNFEPYSELFFLVENIIDAVFYRNVLRVYRKRNRLSSYECLFYPLMGGGVTTAKVMTNEVRLRRHFCFAIVDSDKNSPQGPKGQTCSELQQALVGAPDFCMAYQMKQVKEIENLLPQRVIRELFPLQAGEIDIFARDASFFDMKCGLRFITLLNDTDNNYWKGLLPEKQAEFSQRDALKRANRAKKAFEAALSASDHQILSGFGSSLLKRALMADEEAKGNELQKNERAYNFLQQTEYIHLSAAQQSEWDNIGTVLFSWACGMRAI